VPIPRIVSHASNPSPRNLSVEFNCACSSSHLLGASTRQHVVHTKNQYPQHQSQAPSSSHQPFSADSEAASPSHRYAPYQYTSPRQALEMYQTARSRRPVPPRSFLQRKFHNPRESWVPIFFLLADIVFILLFYQMLGSKRQPLTHWLILIMKMMNTPAMNTVC
jgi:hypothetical protein